MADTISTYRQDQRLAMQSIRVQLMADIISTSTSSIQESEIQLHNFQLHNSSSIHSIPDTSMDHSLLYDRCSCHSCDQSDKCYQDIYQKMLMRQAQPWDVPIKQVSILNNLSNKHLFRLTDEHDLNSNIINLARLTLHQRSHHSYYTHLYHHFRTHVLHQLLLFHARHKTHPCTTIIQTIQFINASSKPIKILSIATSIYSYIRGKHG